MSVINPNPAPWLLQKMVGSVSRHLLTGIAGSLAVAAGLTGDQKQQFITGGASVVVWLFGAGWSYLEKRDQMKPNTVPNKVMANTTVATAVVKTPADDADARDDSDDNRLLGG